ncbi:hypothetical protein [Agrococcus sp. ARC_14]|uniref:hypothetical protein n=1 Tax=Agrococcus sp. ARC_14 TaxID=2919927 RepID=UPI001F05C8CF|nr:hypothetical protein [Agrococcus sp. ARC_14]MCH1882759.1 hypothetical protein [Agrococcus sp. ARC_14]
MATSPRPTSPGQQLPGQRTGQQRTAQPAAPRHWILRASFWAFAAAIIVLPAWIMFGRGLAGAPLGEALLLQAFLGPGLAIIIAVVVGMTFARKGVRGPRAVAWRDLRLVGPWLLVIALMGLTVVDTAGGRTGSALTAWFGDGWLTASHSFTAIAVMVTIIGGIVLFWLQVLELGRETRKRVERVVNDMQAPLLEQQARQADASFERIDGPQSGRVIRIEDEEQP